MMKRIAHKLRTSWKLRRGNRTDSATTPEELAESDPQVLSRRYKTAKDQSFATLAEKQYYISKTPAYRALMLRRIRIWSALIGGILMLGLGAWSAVGVHHSVAGDAERWSVEWILGWVLEPVLLCGVALIIIVRSALALAGARLTAWAWALEIGLLGLSLGANIHALPPNPQNSDYVLRLTGPIGCLLVSLVLAAIEAAIRAADITVSKMMETKPSAGRLSAIGEGLADVSAHTVLKGIGSVRKSLTGDASATPGIPHTPPTGASADTPSASTQNRPDVAPDTSPGRGERTADASADASADAPSADRSATADTPSATAPKAADTPSADTTFGPVREAATSVFGSTDTPAPRVGTTRPGLPQQGDSDTPAGTADAPSADTGKTEQSGRMHASADTSSVADTQEIPAASATRMSLEDAMAKARTLPLADIERGVRPLARQIGCSKSLAQRVRDELLAEAARNSDLTEDHDLTSTKEHP